MGSGEADSATAEEAELESARASLALRGDLRGEDLEALCAELADVERELGSVDLSDLGALEPPTLALLVAALQNIRRRGICEQSQIKPCCRESGSCLGPEGIAALGEGGGRWELTEGERLLGWQSFADGEHVLDAALMVAMQLRQHTMWSARSITALAGAAFEMAENVRQHSRSADGNVAFEIDLLAERARLAVADTGVGIRASLSRNPAYAEIDDDLEAIEHALQAGQSAEPGTGGGMGLYLIRALVRDNDGSVLVRSGDACCVETSERRRERLLTPLRGTVIAIDVQIDRPLEGQEIRERMLALSGAGGVGKE